MMRIKPIQFILTAIVLIGIDMIYLKLATPFFKSQIKKIQGEEMSVRFYSVFIAYIMLITGLYYFIIGANKTSQEGAIFGFIVYGIFDFTNHAIFKNYTLSLAIMDMIWGGILCGTTTYIINRIKYLKI